MTHTLSSADISILLPEISNFSCIKKYRHILHSNMLFLILSILFESLKVVLINMVAIMMMPLKLATLDLLKLKVF